LQWVTQNNLPSDIANTIVTEANNQLFSNKNVQLVSLIINDIDYGKEATFVITKIDKTTGVVSLKTFIKYVNEFNIRETVSATHNYTLTSKENIKFEMFAPTEGTDIVDVNQVEELKKFKDFLPSAVTKNLASDLIKTKIGYPSTKLIYELNPDIVNGTLDFTVKIPSITIDGKDIFTIYHRKFIGLMKISEIYFSWLSGTNSSFNINDIDSLKQYIGTTTYNFIAGQSISNLYQENVDLIIKPIDLNKTTEFFYKSNLNKMGIIPEVSIINAGDNYLESIKSGTITLKYDYYKVLSIYDMNIQEQLGLTIDGDHFYTTKTYTGFNKLSDNYYLRFNSKNKDVKEIMNNTKEGEAVTELETYQMINTKGYNRADIIISQEWKNHQLILNYKVNVNSIFQTELQIKMTSPAYIRKKTIEIGASVPSIILVVITLITLRIIYFRRKNKFNRLID